jgi:serine/threonine protein kinase
MNILLDEKFSPRIADFGLSRSAENDANEVMTTEIGTAAWMAPELIESKPYTEKVDVYSYAMILWELLVGRTPFHGHTGVQIAVMVSSEKKRPPLSTSVPEKLKKLIKLCWNADPKKRPAFQIIVQNFEKHLAKFEGSVDRDFDRIIAQLKKPVKGKKSIVMQELPPELRGSESPIVQNSLRFPDPFQSTFTRDLADLTKNVTLETLQQYYSEVSRLLSQVLPPDELIILLNNLLNLFNRSREYIIEFLKQQIHTRLPLHADCRKELLSLFLHIFTINPASLSTKMIEYVSDNAKTYPTEVLRLFNIYLSFIPELPFIKNTFALLLNLDYIYLRSNFTTLFFRVIHSAICCQPRLKTTFLDKINSLLITIFEDERREISRLVLQILFIDNTFENILQRISFEKLIREPETRESGLMILYRYQERMQITVEILQLLISVAKTSKPTVYVLMQFCENEQIALKMARIGEQWIGENLPTVRMTIKLMMMVVRFQEPHRQLIADGGGLAGLFERVVECRDEKVVTVIGRILRLLPVGASFVKKCGGFLQKYYAFVINKYRELPALTQDAMMLTGMLARVGFSEYFLMLLPVLKVALMTPGWAGVAMPVLAVLSGHVEPRKRIEDDGFGDVIQSLESDDKMVEYVGYYMKNMKNLGGTGV